MTENFKYIIECAVPGELCNLKCSYCYVSQVHEEKLERTKFNYSLEHMCKCFSRKRLGGKAIINFCGGGETLIPDEVIELVKYTLNEGHSVCIVTNLTLNNKIDRLINEIPNEQLKNLCVKGSFHYLELKRLNKLDDYFNNMKKLVAAGASSYPFLVISKEYEPYIDEICKVCIDNIGELPHCTAYMNFKSCSEVYPLDTYTPEYVKYLKEKFKSKIFDLFDKMLKIDVHKEFCYAGEWSFIVNIGTGGMMKCYSAPGEANFFEDPDNMPKLEPIGTNCQMSNCSLYYDLVSLGMIPNLEEIPTYGDLLNKEKIFNPEYIQQLQTKFYDYKQLYTPSQMQKINKLVATKFFKAKHKNLSFKSKIIQKIYNYLKNIKG